LYLGRHADPVARMSADLWSLKSSHDRPNEPVRVADVAGLMRLAQLSSPLPWVPDSCLWPSCLLVANYKGLIVVCWLQQWKSFVKDKCALRDTKLLASC